MGQTIEKVWMHNMCCFDGRVTNLPVHWLHRAGGCSCACWCEQNSQHQGELELWTPQAWQHFCQWFLLSRNKPRLRVGHRPRTIKMDKINYLNNTFHWFHCIHDEDLIGIAITYSWSVSSDCANVAKHAVEFTNFHITFGQFFNLMIFPCTLAYIWERLTQKYSKCEWPGYNYWR